MDDEQNRRTGRSTRWAFMLFSRCYETPNEWVKITDHYPTREADRFLFNTMEQMASDLGFEFEFNHDKKRGEFYVMLPLTVGSYLR